VSQTMQQELPEGAHCVNLKLVGPTSGRRSLLRAALVCDTKSCQALRQTWQQRSLCHGSYTATFISFSDTFSPAHSATIAKRLPKSNPSETGLALELPARWVTQVLPPGQETFRLAVGSHWFDFSTLFGQVLQADIVRMADPNIATLLVNFAQTSAARAMAEALTERYLYNPRNTKCNDTHPAVCTLGTCEKLLERLRSQPATEMAFTLRRIGAAEKKAGPASIRITSEKHRLTFGREEDCTVMLRRPHVSKKHAIIALQPRLGSSGLVLTIQDTSANGTWVNGKRLRSQSVTDLQVGDRISFLPEQHDYYKDALMYEVVSGLDAGPVATGASESSQPEAKNFSGKKRTHEEASEDPKIRESQRRKRHSAVAQQSSEVPLRSASSANVHVAQPVGLDAADTGIVADNGVVDVDGDGEPSPSEVPSEVDPTVPWTVSDDVGAWVRGLDGGSVAQYEASLSALFETVSQIRELYPPERLNDFFADVGVQDPMHQLAFSTALKHLRQ